MLVDRYYKTEIDPNNVQRTILAKHAGAARFTWNWALNRRMEEYKLTGRSSSAIDQHRQLNTLKAIEFPWMYDVSKCAMQESLRDLDKAFKNFFSGRTGYPKFKGKKHGLGGFRLTGAIHVEPDRIKLPRIGLLRLKESDYIPTIAKVKSVTVKERAGRWFVSVQVEEDIVVPENQGPAVGIDLGLKSLIVDSDGGSIPPPKPLFKSFKRLRRLSKRHSRKKKGSMNRRKSARKLARLHYRVACQRSDCLHKITTRLAKTKSVIVIEDLNISGMVRNHCLARSISDAGWSELVRRLEYKTKWYGSKLVKADRFFPSTKMCSGCGHVKDEMSLAERVYRCDYCGLVMDRDVNAAKNLLNQSTVSSTGFQACGDSPLGGSMKQEPSVVSSELVLENGGNS